MNKLNSSVALAIAATAAAVSAQNPSMVRGIGWRTEAIFTVGETVGSYQPVGILDGVAAFPGRRPGTALVLVNHELNEGNGYAYDLANGTSLTGARVSAMEISRTRNGGVVRSAGLAYDTIYDRQGNVVTDPAQVNEDGNAIDGFARFCSSQGVQRGTYGFVDDLYFTGEESGTPFHPHGGSEWVVDVRGRAIWAAPALGRGAWENVTAIDTGRRDTVALLLGDDTAGAPMYLYVGQKNALGDRSFLDRNGLAVGQLHYWVADNGDTSPQQFNTKGNSRRGHFVAIDVQDASMAGMPGYDAQGYLDDSTLRDAAVAAGAFQFSRPEDLHTNPANGRQVAFASTGRGQLFPADNWGTTYIIEVDFAALGAVATFSIISDADGEPVPDMDVRSPDNLCWADNGNIYINEDRSTSPSSLFGAVSGMDASIWELDASNGWAPTRIGEVNRTVVLPLDATDAGAGTLGVPETSGVLDVTAFFPTQRGETLLLATVQAHGIQDGSIGGNPLLDEGGQLIFLTNQGVDHALRCTDNGTGVDITIDVTNGNAGNGYAIVLAVQNAGNAPFGWFYGVDVTVGELAYLVPPLVGLLDGEGNGRADFTLPGLACPLGLRLDTVALEVAMDGTPAQAGPAVTLDF